MTSNERWTPHEDEKAKQLSADGHTSTEIARLINRSADSIRRRLNHLGKTQEERESILALKREQKRVRKEKLGPMPDTNYVPRQVIPDHVLDDLNRRLGVSHTTITGWMMGDPLPGRSALDQRAR